MKRSLLILSTSLLFVGQIKAQFTGSFDISNWNLISVSASSDANIDSSGAPGQIVFNGNNSGAGDCCNLYDDLEITIPLGCSGSGQICFDYGFVNPDIESFYYVVNGTQTFVTSNGNGNLCVNVNAGDQFAFRIITDDDCCGMGVLTITNFSYTDSDDTPPVISPMMDVTMNNTISSCTVDSSLVNLGTPIVTDNCSGVDTVYNDAPSEFSVGTTTVTWTAIDSAGNVANITQDVIIEDQEAPVPNILNLVDITESCELTSLSSPMANDNCDGIIFATHNVVLPITQSTTITWTYEDNSGNITTQDQEVIIGFDLTVVPSNYALFANYSSATATYQWINCEDNTPITGATDQVYNATANGNYAVIISDGGCSDTTDCANISKVSTDNFEKIKTIQLYPNPNNGQFTIDFGQIVSSATLQIRDLQGRIVEQKSISNVNHCSVFIEGATGVYIANIQTSGETFNLRIIKE